MYILFTSLSYHKFTYMFMNTHTQTQRGRDTERKTEMDTERWWDTQAYNYYRQSREMCFNDDSV